MKILLIGIPFTKINLDPVNTLVGNRVRTWMLFTLLKKYGFKTYIFIDKNTAIDRSIDEELSQNFITDLNITIDLVNKNHFDYVILCSTNFEFLVQNHPWLLKLKTNNLIGAFCYHNSNIQFVLKHYFFYKKFRGIFYITPLQSIFHSKYFSIPSFTLTTGQTGQFERKKPLDKSAIFIGEIRSPEKVRLMIKVAQSMRDYTHYLITGRILDQNNKNKVLVNLIEGKEREMLSEALQCDLPDNFVVKNIPYGEEKEIMNSITVGLDFSWNKRHLIENSKVARYLSYGLYTVAEKPSPSFRYIHHFGHGRVVEYNASVDVWIQAIRESENVDLNKVNEVRNQACQYFSWNNAAGEIASFIFADCIYKENSFVARVSDKILKETK